MIDPNQYDRIRRALPILGRADSQLAREFQQVASCLHNAGRVFSWKDHVDGIVAAPRCGACVQIGRQDANALYRFGLGRAVSSPQCDSAINLFLPSLRGAGCRSRDDSTRLSVIARCYDIWRSSFCLL
jgi:hypothetical protein